MNGSLYDLVCAQILVQLDDWKTVRVAGASPGQMRSLVAAGLVVSSPDYRKYDTRTAHNYPRVYCRTKAGDRAAELIAAMSDTEGSE